MMLAGKQVLITGGGSGLGAELAKGFAAQGARVVIAGRRAEALVKTAADNVLIRAITADVTDEASVKALFASAGPCDIVIANAGSAESGPVARTSLEQWNTVLAVNLTGVFLTLREGLSQMTGWGRLIAISSTAGLKGFPYVAPYVAAKHGVVGLVRGLALELGKKAITVNALCPGFLDTEMTERSIENLMIKTGRSHAEALTTLASQNSNGQLIAPADVVTAALRLCSNGSDTMNGQAIAIDGGPM